MRYACEDTLCTTKLPQTRSSTTVYYKADSNAFAILPSTTKLARNRIQYYGIYYKNGRNTVQYYRILQNPHKHVPVRPYTTKLAQSRPQYCRILQRLQKHVPVLPYTTKLAQTRSQYYSVLQSLHKALPSTTVYYKARAKLLPSTAVYYKACTKHFPVLLCTTKLAQSTSQYCCVLQSLHKALPVLLCATKKLHW